jgi:hypothetical protein
MNYLEQNKWNSKFIYFLQNYSLLLSWNKYNECDACNFFLLAKNLCITHNVYQYVNKEQGKKLIMQWKQQKIQTKKELQKKNK